MKAAIAPNKTSRCFSANSTTTPGPGAPVPSQRSHPMPTGSQGRRGALLLCRSLPLHRTPRSSGSAAHSASLRGPTAFRDSFGEHLGALRGGAGAGRPGGLTSLPEPRRSEAQNAARRCGALCVTPPPPHPPAERRSVSSAVEQSGSD